MRANSTPSVYLITNTVNGKRYVGCSIRPHQRWYDHRWYARHDPILPLHRAMAKHGVEAFRFEALESCESHAQMQERERHWIATLGTVTPSGYNITEGGDAPKGHAQSAEAVAKRAAAIRGTKWSDEARRRFAEQCKSRPPEHARKISEALTGKVPSEATRAKLRAANLGKKQSPDTIERRMAQLRGRTQTDQARANMSVAQRGRPKSAQERINIARAGASLTDAQAAIIRYDMLGLLGKEYGALFGLSPQAISGIRAGRSYRHVTREDLPS